MDENDNGSSSDEKDKKPAAKMIPTVIIIWRVRRVRTAMTVSLLNQVTKKREMKETRSRVEESLQGHSPGEHCWCVAQTKCQTGRSNLKANQAQGIEQWLGRKGCVFRCSSWLTLAHFGATWLTLAP